MALSIGNFGRRFRALTSREELALKKRSLLLITLLLPLVFGVAPLSGARAGSLQPPVITVLQSGPQVADGLIFVAPKGAGLGGTTSGPVGPEIVDNQGRPVWFYPITNGQVGADFRVQQYQGRHVLTWAQEQGFGGLATGQSADYIFDEAYESVAVVHAGNGLNADAHEFLISPEDTALITIYNSVPKDLSSVGGSSSGYVIDGVVQEIDIPSGNVLFEWHSLDHVGLDESYEPLPASSTTPWDYFHLNAISVDLDGNLLISARHTSTVYKLDRHTGEVIWRLGGKKTDFTLGTGLPFWYQHNPVPVSDDTFRLFDNESNGTPVLPYSRVIWVQRNPLTKTAEVIRSIKHPAGLSAPSQGGSQGLPNGDTFVGWGQVGRFSEFDPSGNLIFDASVPAGDDTYRAYRNVWYGQPYTSPTATAQAETGGTTLVQAIWNGATRVATWDVFDGAKTHSSKDPKGHGFPSFPVPVASAPWNGLDTAITVKQSLSSVVVVALDAEGREIGRSAVTPVGD